MVTPAGAEDAEAAPGSGVETLPLVQDRLEFGDRLEILRAARGALDLDQPRQVEAEAGDAEGFDRLRCGAGGFRREDAAEVGQRPLRARRPAWPSSSANR